MSVVSGVSPDSGSSEVRSYHRRLPHWRVEGATYLITWRLWATQSVLSSDERSLVASALRFFHGQRYDLHAFVVMDNHVHLVVQPYEGQKLERVVQSWKSFTAKALMRNPTRSAPVWQDEYYDRVIRNERELLEKVNYVLDNPFRRWEGISEYEWAGTGSS